MKTIELSNNFHNTSIRLQAGIENGHYYLSENQIKEARRVLCGSDDCKCSSGPAKTRGSQLYYLDPDYIGEGPCKLIKAF